MLSGTNKPLMMSVIMLNGMTPFQNNMYSWLSLDSFHLTDIFWMLPKVRLIGILWCNSSLNFMPTMVLNSGSTTKGWPLLGHLCKFSFSFSFVYIFYRYQLGATTLSLMTFSITTLSMTVILAVSSTIMLSLIMLSVIMLTVILLSVITLSVALPLFCWMFHFNCYAKCCCFNSNAKCSLFYCYAECHYNECCSFIVLPWCYHPYQSIVELCYKEAPMI